MTNSVNYRLILIIFAQPYWKTIVKTGEYLHTYYFHFFISRHLRSNKS